MSVKGPAERRRDELKALLRQQGFTQFIAWFFREARILDPSCSADGAASLRSEGRRSLGLRVFHELRAADPRACAQFLMEPAPTPREADHDDSD